jgi:hypothetical protein
MLLELILAGITELIPLELDCDGLEVVVVVLVVVDLDDFPLLPLLPPFVRSLGSRRAASIGARFPVAEPATTRIPTPISPNASTLLATNYHFL